MGMRCQVLVRPRNCSRLRGRKGSQRKFRTWLPLHKKPNSPQIPASLNSYAATQGNRILKNNGGRGAGFRSSTTSTAFNLCWTRRIQPQQPQIQTLVVASK